MDGHTSETSSKFEVKKDPIMVRAMGQFDFLVKPTIASSAWEQEETATNSTARAGDFSAAHGEEDEGFKTPTLPDRRIPQVIQQCPHAPRKPRAIAVRTKKIRKPSGHSRRLLLDLSIEVEALFPLTIRKNFCRKIESTSNKVTSSEEDVENKLS